MPLYLEEKIVISIFEEEKDDVENIFLYYKFMTFIDEHNKGLEMFLSHTLHILMFWLSNCRSIRIFIQLL